MNSILTTTSVEQALLDRIYRHVATQSPNDTDVSLLSGQMGYALFEAYTHRFYGYSDDSRIWERVAICLNAIESGQLIHSFAVGIAGVAWGFLHLCNQDLLKTDGLDAQDIVADLDVPLVEVSLDMLRNGDFDYLHGGLSVGLYLLERQSSPAIAQLVEALVEQLAAVAHRLPNGDISWNCNFGRPANDNTTCYNMGLSHGTASIVALLCLFYQRGYACERCAKLIQGSLQWIWKNRNRSGYSVFPNVVVEERKDKESRLAWCYGDLGMANTFWLAGQTFNNPDWLAIAQNIILHANRRREFDNTHISDAGLCHGTAGAAHIFRQFAQRIPHPLLNKTADFWFQRTAEYALPENAEDVFLSYQINTYYPALDLLEGEAGIGLALLTELGAPAHWQRCLLLS